MAVETHDANLMEYRQTHWEPEYTPRDTDILAVFKLTAQPGVSREEAAAAVAAESSNGAGATIQGFPGSHKGRAYAIDDMPGDDTSFYAFIAYPLDLFKAASDIHSFTARVGNVSGFNTVRALCLEDVRFPVANG